jgi:orotidine-5'-phosphate decarboxylase
MLSLCPGYGCALRLDQGRLDALLGHARKTLSDLLAVTREAPQSEHAAAALGLL